MYDLLVKNGKIVTAEAVYEGNVAVKDGKSRQFFWPERNRKLPELWMQKGVMYSRVQLILMHI